MTKHERRTTSSHASLDHRETTSPVSDDDRRSSAQLSKAEFLRQFYERRDARREAKARCAAAQSITSIQATPLPRVINKPGEECDALRVHVNATRLPKEELNEEPLHFHITHRTMNKKSGSTTPEYNSVTSSYSSTSHTIRLKGKQPERCRHDHASIALASILGNKPRASPVSSVSASLCTPADPGDVEAKREADHLDSDEALKPSSILVTAPCSALTKLGERCQSEGKYPGPSFPRTSDLGVASRYDSEKQDDISFGYVGFAGATVEGPLYCLQHARAMGYLPLTLERKCSDHATIEGCMQAKAALDGTFHLSLSPLLCFMFSF